MTYLLGAPFYWAVALSACDTLWSEQRKFITPQNRVKLAGDYPLIGLDWITLFSLVSSLTLWRVVFYQSLAFAPSPPFLVLDSCVPFV